MNRDFDAEITDALEAEAAAHEMTPGAWSRLSGRMEALPGTRRGRGVLVAAALIVTIAVVGAIALTRIRDDSVDVTADGGTAACGPGAATFALTRADPEFNPGNAEVAVAGDDGSFRSITAGWDAAADPSFAPDGTRLAVVRVTPDYEEPDTMEIWSLATDGGGRRQLTTGHLDSDPSWSPDDRQIAFRRWDRETGIGRLMTVPSEGGAAKPLLALGDRSLQAPSWSPDGTKLAFAAAGAPHGAFDQPGDEVWVTDTTDGATNPHLVARVPAARHISWYPSGDALLVSTFASEDGTVSRVDLPDRTVTPLIENATQATVSADGTTAYLLEKREPTESDFRAVRGRLTSDSIEVDRVYSDQRLYPYEFYGSDVSRCAGVQAPSVRSTTTDPRLGGKPALGLPQSGGCGDAYFWLATADGSVAVTFTVDLDDRSTQAPTTASFDLPSPDITATLWRGRDLPRNFCTDVIDSRSEPTRSSPIEAGHVEITVDPRNPDLASPCGDVHGSIRVNELRAEDGTTFATTTGETDSIGCYAG